MSRTRGTIGAVFRATSLILMGLIALLFGIFFVAVFVPAVGWYIWKLNDRNRDLEARLAALEGPKKPDKE